MKTFRLIISGKVQGVNYRASARQQAIALQLTGTVRNLPDGTVEAIATGDTEQLHAFVEWAKQGPSAASVSGVVVEELPMISFADFNITR